MLTDYALEALQAVRQAATEARAAGNLLDFLTELERVRLEFLLTPATAEKPVARIDRLLTAKETAERIGVSVWWIRKNKDSLPIVRLPTGRYGFSEKGLQKWIERRAAS